MVLLNYGATIVDFESPLKLRQALLSVVKGVFQMSRRYETDII